MARNWKDVLQLTEYVEDRIAVFEHLVSTVGSDKTSHPGQCRSKGREDHRCHVLGTPSADSVILLAIGPGEPQQAELK